MGVLPFKVKYCHRFCLHAITNMAKDKQGAGLADDKLILFSFADGFATKQSMLLSEINYYVRIA